MHVTIDPQSFVSRNDLRLDFGIRDAEIDEAIRTGQLTPVQGGSHFLGSEVITFLTSNQIAGAGRHSAAVVQLNTVAPQQRAPATSAQRPNERNSTMPIHNQQATAPTGPAAIALFDSKVRARVEEGLERTVAVDSVIKRNPELHKQYLRATNLTLVGKRYLDEKFDEQKKRAAPLAAG